MVESSRRLLRSIIQLAVPDSNIACWLAPAEEVPLYFDRTTNLSPHGQTLGVVLRTTDGAGIIGLNSWRQQSSA